MNHSLPNLSQNLQTVLAAELKTNRPVPILTWKSRKVQGALVTKIGNQKYLGVLKKDKKGQEYWRYHLLSRFTSSSSNSEPAEVSEESSSEVQKFREKYGYSDTSEKPTQ